MRQFSKYFDIYIIEKKLNFIYFYMFGKNIFYNTWMRVTHLKFKTHAMKPRAGTWRQVARKEIHMVSIDEVMGIECNSIRVQRTGT